MLNYFKNVLQVFESNTIWLAYALIRLISVRIFNSRKIRGLFGNDTSTAVHHICTQVNIIHRVKVTSSLAF